MGNKATELKFWNLRGEKTSILMVFTILRYGYCLLRKTVPNNRLSRKGEPEKAFFSPIYLHLIK